VPSDDPEENEPKSLVGRTGVLRVKDEVYNGVTRSGVSYFIDPADVDQTKLLVGKVVTGNNGQSVDEEVRASVAEKLGVEDAESDEIPGTEPEPKAGSEAEVKPESKAALERMRAKLKTAPKA
jgi:hypothetical protein